MNQTTTQYASPTYDIINSRRTVNFNQILTHHYGKINNIFINGD